MACDVRIRAALRTALVGILLVCTGPWLEATLIAPVAFETLVSEADLIVTGRVADVRARFSPRGEAERVVTLDVSAVHKGSAGGVVAVVSPGGQIGSLRTIVIGAPEFSAGDELVAFLGAGPGQEFRVIGLRQGLFPVAVDGGNGDRFVRSPELEGRALVIGIGSRVGQGPVRLDVFTELVRAVVRNTQGRRR